MSILAAAFPEDKIRAKNTARLCQCHFEEDDYKLDTYGNVTLKPNVLPTFDVKVERMKYLAEKIKIVEKERDEAREKWKNLVKGAHSILSEEQLEVLVKIGINPNYKHNKEWNGESIANGLVVKQRLCSEKTYNWFISQGYPFPSVWSLQRFQRHMRDMDDQEEASIPVNRPDDIFPD